MRIQVLHDNAGNILSIFAPAEGGRKGGIESATPDTTVIEVDAPDIEENTQLPEPVTKPSTEADQNERVAATLAYLMEHYEVVSGGLVERSGRSTG
jgi:hypothetical protein